MDDFREWLSDNLRYIMLGAGILFGLVIIFFGIRFLSSALGSNEKDNPEKIEAEASPTPEATETPTPTPTPTVVITDKLIKNGVPEVTELIDKYYNAIAGKDIATLRTLVDNLTVEDENNINAETVLAYNDIQVYTKAVDQTGSAYITFVSYKYQLSGITTAVPGLSQLYICSAENGSYYISTSVPSPEIQTKIDETILSNEVQALVSNVQSQYETAINTDPALYAYFYPSVAAAAPEPTPEVTAEPTATPEVTATPEATISSEVLTLKSAANFRSEPNNTSAIIRTCTAGTQMVKLGEEDGFYKVEINGEVGYIAKRFF